MKSYIIIYNYNHTKFGFQNQITIQAQSEQHAINTAKEKCTELYGIKQIKKFTFKIPSFVELMTNK